MIGNHNAAALGEALLDELCTNPTFRTRFLQGMSERNRLLIGLIIRDENDERKSIDDPHHGDLPG